jgi:hypothetical protein
MSDGLNREPSIQLKLLVDQHFPSVVPPNGKVFSTLLRWSVYIVGAGLLLLGVGLLIDVLGLVIAGMCTIPLAGFPALMGLAGWYGAWSDRRGRPADRAALLAGDYRDVQVVTTRITGGIGRGGQSVRVDVVARDGRKVAFHLGKTGILAEHIARTLINEMSAERREKYEMAVLRDQLR